MAATNVREQLKAAAEAKFNARVERSVDAVTRALEVAGWRAEKQETRGVRQAHHVIARREGVPSVNITWSYIARGGMYYSDRTGDERMVIGISCEWWGRDGEKIQSAKEDPDLTTARVPRVVAAVEAIASQKQARIEHEQKEQSNVRSSKAIASACNVVLSEGGEHLGMFGAVPYDPDTVEFTATCRFKGEDAKRFAALLATFKRSES